MAPRTAQRAGGKGPDTTNPPYTAAGRGVPGLLARNWPGNSAVCPAAAEMEETDFPPPAGKECLPVQNRAYRKNITQIII